MLSTWAAPAWPDPTQHNVAHINGLSQKFPPCQNSPTYRTTLIQMTYIIHCCNIHATLMLCWTSSSVISHKSKAQIQHSLCCVCFILSLITWNFYFAVIFATCFFLILSHSKKKLRLNWKMLLEKFLSLLTVSAGG